MRNLLRPLAEPLARERVESLVQTAGVRIERIVSRGHASPPGFWYDQDENEWVLLLSGAARLLLAGESEPRLLGPGDCLEIPAHLRHRVEWTDPEADTIWLAVFYAGASSPS